MTSIEMELKQLASDFQSFRANRPTPLARIPSNLWDRALSLADRLSVRAVAKACCLGDAHLRTRLKTARSGGGHLAGAVRVAPVTIDLASVTNTSGSNRVTIRSKVGEMVIEPFANADLPLIVRAFVEGSR
jgi:hypothetical protein